MRCSCLPCWFDDNNVRSILQWNSIPGIAHRTLRTVDCTPHKAIGMLMSSVLIQRQQYKLVVLSTVEIMSIEVRDVRVIDVEDISRTDATS